MGSLALSSSSPGEDIPRLRRPSPPLPRRALSRRDGDGVDRTAADRRGGRKWGEKEPKGIRRRLQRVPRLVPGTLSDGESLRPPDGGAGVTLRACDRSAVGPPGDCPPPEELRSPAIPARAAHCRTRYARERRGTDRPSRRPCWPAPPPS